MHTRRHKTKGTRKVETGDLKKIAVKYTLSPTGSKTELANRLWKLRSHVMTLKHLKIVEDFLNMPKSKRFKGQRFHVLNNGNLQKI